MAHSPRATLTEKRDAFVQSESNSSSNLRSEVILTHKNMRTFRFRTSECSLVRITIEHNKYLFTNAQLAFNQIHSFQVKVMEDKDSQPGLGGFNHLACDIRRSGPTITLWHQNTGKNHQQAHEHPQEVEILLKKSNSG